MIIKEIENHDPAISKILHKISAISSEHKFFKELEKKKDELLTDWNSFKTLAAERLKRIQDSVVLHKVGI